MKLSQSVIALYLALHAPTKVAAFTQSRLNSQRVASSPITSLSSLAVVETDEDLSSSPESLNYDGVKNLTFRELQRECKERGLAATGNTATLRSRLLDAIGIFECTGTETEAEEVSSCSGCLWKNEHFGFNFFYYIFLL